MHKPSNTLQQVKEWLEKRSRFPFETMKKWDALYYIQQLESRLAQAERERNAAVHDLPIGIDCDTCKYGERAYEEQPCSGCKEYRGPWYPLHWEWRGVCEENTHDQPSM